MASEKKNQGEMASEKKSQWKMASEKKSQGEMASEKNSPKRETDSSDDDSSSSSVILSYFFSGKCERNFSIIPGQIVLDGCQEFMPDHQAEEGTPSALFCDACGCHEFEHEQIVEYVTKSP